MTREEAKDFLTKISYALGNMSVEYLSEKDGERMREAIKALEHPERNIISVIPCGDAISRQAAIDAIGNVPDHDDGMVWEALSHAQRNVALLPLVTPQPKMGKWIDNKCSICGKGIEDLISSSEWYINEEPNFCPFCGVKIKIESKEEEYDIYGDTE